MPGFALTPVAGFNPQVPDEFPVGLQFQLNGENLGGPDVDTFNVVLGGSGTVLSFTRGTGEFAGTVTLTIPLS